MAQINPQLTTLTALPDTTASQSCATTTQRSGSRRRLPAFLVLSALALLPTACKLGPDYQRPTVPTADSWRWKVGEPSDHLPKGDWWLIFDDPALNALQSTATEANQELKAAIARVEQARASARFNRSDLFPSLSAEPAGTRYRTSGNSPSPVPFPVPSFTQSQYQVPFDLTYEVDLWGRVRRGFEATRHQAFAAESARQFVLLTLQADVATQYFSIQHRRQEIALLRQTIAIREEALDLFRKRLEAGIGNEFEIERARVEVENARAALTVAEQREAELFNALAVLCGQPPAKFQPDIAPTPPRPPQIAPNLPSTLLERRPDVAQAERELAARNAQIGVAKAAPFPVLRLTTTGGFLSGELTDLFEWESRVWTIGPSLTIPIFQAGRAKANLARSRAAYDETLALYRQKILTSFKDVEDSLAAIGFLDRQLTSREAAAQAARNAARLSFERYSAGTVSFLEIVDAENARLQSEIALAQTRNERLLAVIRLLKSLGGGWHP